MAWGRDPRPRQEAGNVRAETPRARVEHEITPPREEPHFHSGEQPTHHERKTLGSLWITPPVHEPEPLLPASHGSMEHPPKMFGLTRKAGYLALGIPMGLAAIGLWSFDILAHLTALPFDDVIFHGAAAVATVAAVPLLNAVWRGYGPSLGEIGKNTWSAVKSVGRGIRDSILKGARVIEGTNHVSEHETHTHIHTDLDERGMMGEGTRFRRPHTLAKILTGVTEAAG